MSRRHGLSFVVAAAALIFAKSAFAQLPAPAPPAGQPAAQPAPLWSPGTTAQGTAGATAAAPAPAAAAPVVDDGTTDQERFVGHFGVKYFGVSQIAIADPSRGLAGPLSANVNAPTIGARYWLQRSLGIDVGLGFGLQSGSNDVTAGAATTSVDAPGIFALVVHGGVPLVLGRGKHYAFELTPEANFGFATGSVKGANGGGDISISGSRIDLGGRIGAEIFFGFIGIPELALEASVGLFLHRTAFKASQDASPMNAAGGFSSSQLNIGTTVQSDPWAIFANNISATYYF